MSAGGEERVEGVGGVATLLSTDDLLWLEIGDFAHKTYARCTC